MDEKEKYYKVKEAATISRFSVSTINNSIRDGKLQATQIPDSSSKGYHYLIAESDLKRWLSERKADVAELKSTDDIAAMINRMIREAYERGVKDGKEEARRTLTDAMRGLK